MTSSDMGLDLPLPGRASLSANFRSRAAAGGCFVRSLNKTSSSLFSTMGTHVGNGGIYESAILSNHDLSILFEFV